MYYAYPNLLPNQSGIFHCHHRQNCIFNTRCRSVLKAHLIKVSRKPYTCVKCGYFNGTGLQVLDHFITKHMKQYPYHCRICRKGFGVQNSLYKHLCHVHHLNTEQQRAEYRKYFPEEDLLQRQRMANFQPTPIVTQINCIVCQWNFNNNDDRRIHKLVSHFQPAKDTVPCNFCGKKFTTLNGMRVHHND